MQILSVEVVPQAQVVTEHFEQPVTFHDDFLIVTMRESEHARTERVILYADGRSWPTRFDSYTETWVKSVAGALAERQPA